MNRLLLRSSARFYARRPAQGLLAVAGIGLGVAVFIGVTLANDAATRAFEESARFIRGRSTHRLLPIGDDMPEQTYVTLARVHGLRAAPVLESRVRLDDTAGTFATLIGIDPIEELGFRDATQLVPTGSGSRNDRLISEPGTALVAEALLEARGRPARLRIVTEAGARDIDVLGAVAADAGDVILTDISTAQELTGRVGRLTRVDLILDPQEAQTLAAALPPATALVSASNENAAFIELTRAFETNVVALGLLALVVGAFLIYSTMAFAIVQRRRPIAILRALGVSQGEILLTLTTEALVIGALGTAVGCALGVVLAEQLVGGVAATIDDFAFRSAVAVAQPSVWLYVRGCCLGLAATVLAAARPLRDAVRIDPARALQRVEQERTAAQRTRLGLGLAAVALVLGTLLLGLPTRALGVAFAGLGCVLAAGALLAPAAIVGTASRLEPLLARIAGLTGRMAARNVRAQQSRIAVAAAALTIAVATVIGVGLMIGSFRTSLTRWLDTTLTSDVYVNAERPFDADNAIAALDALPALVGVSRTRFVELPTQLGTLGVRAFAPGTRGYGLHIVDGDESSAIAGLAAGTHVAIAEPFAYRNGLARGDPLALPTADGPREFPIAGVYRDYNTGGASVLMPLATFREHWNDTRVDALGIELAESLAPEKIRASLGDTIDKSVVRITSTDAIKQISLAIFDRTFEITNVLRTLAGIVAFLGMLSALLAIQLERSEEFAILRALGFPPRGLSALILTETTLTGVAAGIVAIPIGVVLAGVLVHVINRRSFGWTMELTIDAPAIAVGVGLATAAAVLAGVAPSFVGRAPIKGTMLHYD